MAYFDIQSYFLWGISGEHVKPTELYHENDLAVYSSDLKASLHWSKTPKSGIMCYETSFHD